MRKCMASWFLVIGMFSVGIFAMNQEPGLSDYSCDADDERCNPERDDENTRVSLKNSQRQKYERDLAYNREKYIRRLISRGEWDKISALFDKNARLQTVDHEPMTVVSSRKKSFQPDSPDVRNGKLMKTRGAKEKQRKKKKRTENPAFYN